MWTWLSQPMHAPYMRQALAEMVLLSVLCGVVGTLVLLRRAAFTADALSHTVFPGLAIAVASGVSPMIGAVAAAALSVIVLTVARRQQRLDDDSVLALLVGTFFAVGVIVVSRRHSFSSDLTALLFGRLLTVGPTTLVQTTIVAAAALGVVFVLAEELVIVSFDETFARVAGIPVSRIDLVTMALVALVVVASAHAVGTALVISMLIVPPATARLVTDRIGRIVAIAIAIAAFSAFVGLWLSYWGSLDHDLHLAPGATVSVVLTAVFALTLATVTVRAHR